MRNRSRVIIHESLSVFCAVTIIFVLLVFSSSCFPGGSPSASAISLIEEPGEGKNLLIEYSVSYQDNIRGLFQADGGFTYLILDMVIRNNGYEIVNTNPLFFLISYNGTEYHSEIVLLDNNLEPLALEDGHSTTGTIVFQIPKNELQSPFQIKYQPMVGTLSRINIIAVEKE